MVRFVLVVVFLIQGWYADAQYINPKAEDLYAKGIAAMNKGSWQQALSYLDEAINENPAYAEAYSTRGQLRERLNDKRLALQDYTISLELQPEQYEILFARGALLYEMAKFRESKADFEKLLMMNPGETNTVYYRQSVHTPGTDKIFTAQAGIKGQIYNYLGLIEYNMGLCNYAILYLDSAIITNPSEADYFANRALAKMECDTLNAADDFAKALELDPHHPVARHNLALAAAQQGSYELAEKQLTDLIHSDSMMVAPYLERAYYRMLRSDFKAALADYNRAILLKNDDPEIWLNRGLMKEKLNDLKGAFRDYTQAITLQERFVEAWLNRGNVLSKLGRYQEAIEDYSTALVYDSAYAAAYYNRAITYYKLKELAKACTDVQHARRLGMEVDKSFAGKICR